MPTYTWFLLLSRCSSTQKQLQKTPPNTCKYQYYFIETSPIQQIVG
ncbi:MAG: hypothetical protein IPN94_02705 [Sphingobacteriales bacterium]|nr:hypothetical protein [Sphingobacteriales bacterium]